MISAIKKGLKQEVSKLPKTKILYNDCYGSFLLTDHFVGFAYSRQQGSQQGSQQRHTIAQYPERIFPVPHVIPYGQQVAAMYPWVVCAVFNYMYYKLEDVFKHIRHMRKELASPRDIIGVISNEYGFNNSIVQSMLESIDNRISNDGVSINFLDAVHKLSQYNPSIWSYDNNKFEHTAMKFIYDRLSYLETRATRKYVVVANTDIMAEYARSELLPIDMDSVYVELGLLCAAGPGCRLQIAEVPSLLEWKISEYDGLETIDID
jgi:hypothetical protein